MKVFFHKFDFIGLFLAIAVVLATYALSFYCFLARKNKDELMS
jgi:hypothetical protein